MEYQLVDVPSWASQYIGAVPTPGRSYQSLITPRSPWERGVIRATSDALHEAAPATARPVGQVPARATGGGQ
jgi:hypothetical protein